MQYVVLPFLVVVVVDVDRYSLYLFVPLRRHLHCHCHCHCHRRRRHSTLIIDGREEQCSQYFSSGTGISEFYIMWRYQRAVSFVVRVRYPLHSHHTRGSVTLPNFPPCVRVGACRWRRAVVVMYVVYIVRLVCECVCVLWKGKRFESFVAWWHTTYYQQPHPIENTFCLTNNRVPNVVLDVYYSLKRESELIGIPITSLLVWEELFEKTWRNRVYIVRTGFSYR